MPGGPRPRPGSRSCAPACPSCPRTCAGAGPATSASASRTRRCSPRPPSWPPTSRRSRRGSIRRRRPTGCAASCAPSCASWGRSPGRATVTPERLAEMIALIDDRTLSVPLAKEVLAEVIATGAAPAEVVAEKGLGQISDEGELVALVEQLLEDNPAQAAQLRDGKDKLVGLLRRPGDEGHRRPGRPRAGGRAGAGALRALSGHGGAEPLPGGAHSRLWSLPGPDGDVVVKLGPPALIAHEAAALGAGRRPRRGAAGRRRGGGGAGDRRAFPGAVRRLADLDPARLRRPRRPGAPGPRPRARRRGRPAGLGRGGDDPRRLPGRARARPAGRRRAPGGARRAGGGRHGRPRIRRPTGPSAGSTPTCGAATSSGTARGRRSWTGSTPTSGIRPRSWPTRRRWTTSTRRGSRRCSGATARPDLTGRVRAWRPLSAIEAAVWYDDGAATTNAPTPWRPRPSACLDD